MSMHSDELEMLADLTFKDAVIATSLYCGSCGYNLKTLPYVGVCTECGHRYNARPLRMDGIFTPQRLEIPLGDAAAGVLSGLVAAGMTIRAIAPSPSRGVYVLFAVVLGLMSIAFAWIMWRKLCKYAGFRKIAKRIESGVDD